MDTERPAPKTPKKSDITRQKIVESALKLFAERGFEQTTMRVIAEDASLSVTPAPPALDYPYLVMPGADPAVSRAAASLRAASSRLLGMVENCSPIRASTRLATAS